METLTLKQAAEHIHIEANELRHFAQRGEVVAVERGGEWFFRHRDLDEWAQRNLLAANRKEQLRQHRVMLDEHREQDKEDWRIWKFFKITGINLALAGKAKAGVIRDMADLAAQTGLVYDVEGLYSELKAREEAASTAVGLSAAFLHPQFHDPYLFVESFIAYGRSDRPVYFGSSDGEGTRHFFLICSTDHEQHLHILGRLAVMAHSSEFLELLLEATTAEQTIEIIKAAEEGLLK